MSEAAFTVCLESLNPQVGHLYCESCICPVPFTGLSDMMLKAEIICDILDTPHRFSSLHAGDDYDITHQLLESELRSICMPRRSASYYSGLNRNASIFPVIAFSVVIQSRRDCSWQGFVREQNGSRHEYISSLELLLHMQSAIERRQAFARPPEHTALYAEKHI